MKSENITTINELREWLRQQLDERMAGNGIRAIAQDIGLHENTLYGIIKGNKPNFRSAKLLREYYSRNKNGES